MLKVNCFYLEMDGTRQNVGENICNEQYLMDLGYELFFAIHSGTAEPDESTLFFEFELSNGYTTRPFTAFQIYENSTDLCFKALVRKYIRQYAYNF